MGQATIKTTRKQIRKVLGPEVADIVRVRDVRLKAMGAILHRNLLGRLKWILTGK